MIFAVIMPPLVYNAYLHSQDFGTFTCITRDSDDIRWIVDGAAHNHPSAEMRQLEVYNTPLDDPHCLQSCQSVLKIPAIRFNQHITEIKCRAISFSENYWVDSVETAQFNVQGLLDQPNLISYSNHNASHNLIEWQEPFSFNITDVEPDIENYTVCTNVTDEQCINTTATQFILLKYFVDILVNVTPWNIVGKSIHSAQLIVKACRSITDSVITTTGKYYACLLILSDN